MYHPGLPDWEGSQLGFFGLKPSCFDENLTTLSGLSKISIPLEAEQALLGMAILMAKPVLDFGG